MKRLGALMLLMIFITAGLSAQEKLVLFGGGYMQSHLSYEFEQPNGSGLPNENFKDTWTNWGLGSVQYLPGSRGFGFYNSSMLYFLETLKRESSTPYSGDFEEFRLGLDNLSGLGTAFKLGPVGILIGGGVHWDAMYASKYPDTTDSNYWMFSLGLGGGVHLMIPLNEKMGLQVGTLWWWDPLQLRASSSGSLSSDYKWDQGWGYNITGGLVMWLPS